MGGGFFSELWLKLLICVNMILYHSRKRLSIGYEILRQKELNHSISCQSISYEVIFISMIRLWKKFNFDNVITQRIMLTPFYIPWFSFLYFFLPLKRRQRKYVNYHCHLLYKDVIDSNTTRLRLALIFTVSRDENNK